ncbi:MAG: hypothetical protein KDA37_01610, partial [Planctomycetales bacterium]|nr:hypothetical protein [Planctomycetales bacterium]
SGTDFRIDGEALHAEDFNNVTPVDLPRGAVLSGVFSDGTPFAFTSDEGDYFAPGALRVSSNRYLLSPASILLPFGDYVPPRGLLPGQSLTLNPAQNVGDNFTAGWASDLTVAGGSVGQNFEAVGTHVTLADGSIGEDMDVLFGSVLDITGGTIGDGLEAHRGSTVNIAGGTVQQILAKVGSTVNLSGGTHGRTTDDWLRIDLEPGSTLHVFGTNLLVDGRPVEGLAENGTITLSWEDRRYYSWAITGELLDGSPFRASVYYELLPASSGAEDLGLPTITLTLATAGIAVPEPASTVLAFAAILLCGIGRLGHRASMVTPR